MTKVLIVDDVKTNRVLLTQTLNAIGDFELIEASDGQEAIDKFASENPDLILMDIMMPGIDGMQATTLIKGSMLDEYVPIIFITALNSESSLATALESGGDDFISKPFNIEVLESKINVHLRLREMNQQLNKTNDKLTSHNQRLIYEHELITHFFESAIAQSHLDEDIVRYHMSSMSAFNGDILFARKGPRGGLFMIVGDFSGHGLTAAMGTLPVAMIFFKMVEQDATVGEIAEEINRQLNTLMPSSMFFVAVIIELNRSGNILTAWMGGMPEIYWLDSQGDLKDKIHSQHMPLGVLEEHEFDSTAQVFHVEQEDKLYIYSDGVIESRNYDGEEFGNERLEILLTSEKDNRFDKVIDALKIFSGRTNQDDDLSFIELTCKSIQAEPATTKNAVRSSLLPWNMTFSLSADELKLPNPVKKISTVLGSIPEVRKHKDILHVVLSEVFSNSLEHSILGIESKGKKDEISFAEYYEQRDLKTASLDNAFVRFDITYIPGTSRCSLEIAVSDSGRGYQFSEKNHDQEHLHGRGLMIVNEFCQSINFSNDGRTINLVYQL